MAIDITKTLVLDAVPVDLVQNVRTLDILFDENMSWDPHVNLIRTKYRGLEVFCASANAFY